MPWLILQLITPDTLCLVLAEYDLYDRFQSVMIHYASILKSLLDGLQYISFVYTITFELAIITKHRSQLILNSPYTDSRVLKISIYGMLR